MLARSSWKGLQTASSRLLHRHTPLLLSLYCDSWIPHRQTVLISFHPSISSFLVCWRHRDWHNWGLDGGGSGFWFWDYYDESLWEFVWRLYTINFSFHFFLSVYFFFPPLSCFLISFLLSQHFFSLFFFLWFYTLLGERRIQRNHGGWFLVYADTTTISQWK